MIKFTDKRLYLKGTCQAILSDPVTGQIMYFSNKYQSSNITTSVTLGEIRAGIGNPIVAIIPSDSALNVDFKAADFSLWAKAAQVGAALNYNAIDMVCQIVDADSATLKIDVTGGTPVAQYGYSKAFAYVQTVGEAAPIGITGTPYDISTDGTISGFTATTGKQYKVWYFVNKASAQVAALSTMFDPGVYHFSAQMAVYSNDVTSAQNEGTRVGWVYVIVPRLKMSGTADMTGDQSTADTTSTSGQAIAFDEDTISATCDETQASTLAYYIYVPDNAAEDISGLAVVGGVISVPKSGNAQTPVRYVMANGQLVTPTDYASMKYTLTSAPSGTTVSASGLISAGSTTGDCEMTIQYPASGTAEFTTVVNVSITA